eukprot:901196-Pelagomonas_calceolata.AAC.1
MDVQDLQDLRRDWQPHCRADRPGAGTGRRPLEASRSGAGTFQHTEAKTGKGGENGKENTVCAIWKIKCNRRVQSKGPRPVCLDKA